MSKTELLSNYSRHNDYYQLWMEKKKEIEKLRYDLMDSKHVIGVLHLKLTDILNYIKIFEAKHETANFSNQEQVPGDGSHSYAPGVVQNIHSEPNQHSGSPECRSEFVEMDFDQENSTDASYSLERNSEPQCNITEPSDEPQGTNEHRDQRKISVLKESYSPTSNVQGGSISYASELNDSTTQHGRMECLVNRTTDLVEQYNSETEASKTEKPVSTTNLPLRLYDSIKTELVEELETKEEAENYLDNVFASMAVIPTESVQETSLQLYEGGEETQRKGRTRNQTKAKKISLPEKRSPVIESQRVENDLAPDFILSEVTDTSFTEQPYECKEELQRKQRTRAQTKEKKVSKQENRLSQVLGKQIMRTDLSTDFILSDAPGPSFTEQAAAVPRSSGIPNQNVQLIQFPIQIQNIQVIEEDVRISSVWNPQASEPTYDFTVKAEAPIGVPHLERLVDQNRRQDLKGAMMKYKMKRSMRGSKQNHISLEQKFKALKRFDRGEKQQEVAADLSVSVRTVKRWVRGRDKIEQWHVKASSSAALTGRKHMLKCVQ